MTRQKLLQRLAAEVGSVQKTILALADVDDADAEPSAPETTAKTVSLEDVRAVLAGKSRAGHTDAIRELLQKHGATKLSEINPAEYAGLLADAEVLK
jgi:hypothetical protein